MNKKHLQHNIAFQFFVDLWILLFEKHEINISL